MADYWIKAYHEILNDSKMATLPDRLWRRTMEIFLLAGMLSKDKSGKLPETNELAWLLRMNVDDLDMDLKQIQALNIVKKIEGGWLVVNFAKRQAPATDKERKEQQRERERSQQYYGGVTEMSRNVTQINRIQNTESDSVSSSGSLNNYLSLNGLSESFNSLESLKSLTDGPDKTFAQIGKVDYVKIWSLVTGQAMFPGSKADEVMNAMNALSEKYVTPGSMVDYLKPYFEKWITTRTRSGLPYKKNNIAWLIDFAVTGVMPGTDEKEFSF